MGVHTAEANGIEIAYEAFGSPDDPPVLLVMGLGTQMIAWHEGFCEALASRGHYVVRFDNRDVGLSTHLDQVPPPRLRDLLTRRRPPYTINDMADDTVGLMDALGLPDAHVVGASMGGFIAQAVAIRHASRVRSLTLIMTSTGSRLVGNPKARVFARLLRRRVAKDRQSAVAETVEIFRIIGSHGYAFDEEHILDIANRSYARAYDPAGYQRQLGAVTAQANRSRQLAQVRVPALVMHGLDDPMVAPSGGLAAARLLRTSRFVGFSGMGHDLPRALWPDFVAEISALVARADGRVGAPA